MALILTTFVVPDFSGLSLITYVMTLFRKEVQYKLVPVFQTWKHNLVFVWLFLYVCNIIQKYVKRDWVKVSGYLGKDTMNNYLNSERHQDP